MALIAALAGALVAAALAYASDGPAPADLFTLERAVVGAGGSHSTSAGFELDATAAQPVAGSTVGLDAGVMAGFWGAAPPAPGNAVYLPLVLRG